MGASHSHSFCPEGPEGGIMRAAITVLLAASGVLCPPNPDPSPNADPQLLTGLGYGGLGTYGWGGWGLGGWGGAYTYPYYGTGWGAWGRKKRSADPTPDPQADPWYGYWGYTRPWGWGGWNGYYGYASPYWGGWGGWGRKKREADPTPDPNADPDADPHWGAWGYGGWGGYGGWRGYYGYASPYNGWGGYWGRK